MMIWRGKRRRRKKGKGWVQDFQFTNCPTYRFPLLLRSVCFDEEKCVHSGKSLTVDVLKIVVKFTTQRVSGTKREKRGPSKKLKWLFLPLRPPLDTKEEEEAKPNHYRHFSLPFSFLSLSRPPFLSNGCQRAFSRKRTCFRRKKTIIFPFSTRTIKNSRDYYCSCESKWKGERKKRTNDFPRPKKKHIFGSAHYTKIHLDGKK